MNIHIIGKPSSGKGYFGRMLKKILRRKHYQTYTVGTGDAIRQLLAANAEFKRAVGHIISGRGLLSEGHLWQVVQQHIETHNIPINSSEVYTIWDCVLRTPSQVRRMCAEGILGEDDLVVHIDASDEVTRRNLRKRMQKEHRTDDNPSAHNEGLRRFATNLHPVLEAIRECGCPIVRVNANLEQRVWPKTGVRQILARIEESQMTPS